MSHIKNLRLEFITYIAQKYNKNHKRYFLSKKKKINISFMRSLNIDVSIIVTKNTVFIAKHLQCIYKKLKRDVKYIQMKPSILTCFSFVYPSIMLTKKPRDIRMGRGKGALAGICAKIEQGFSFLYFSYFSSLLLSRLLRATLVNLPFKANILYFSQY